MTLQQARGAALCVVGTGTDVGKTVICALLLRHLGAGGIYFKPVQSGLPGDVQCMRRLCPHAAKIAAPLYSFDEPLSPHLAARRMGTRICLQRILEAIPRLQVPMRTLLVEMAGGLLAPLGEAGETMVDVVAHSGLPCVLVAKAGVGTINHTLLSLLCLRERGIAVRGVILNETPSCAEVALCGMDNAAVIARQSGVAVLGLVPRMPRLDTAHFTAAAARLNLQGVFGDS